MTHNDYWAERFTLLEEALNQQGQGTYAKIETAFIQAQKTLQRDIESWYSRLASNNELSMTEAKKFLTTSQLEEFRWSVEEYIQYGQENAFNGQWMKQLENASAKVHISRLESLQISAQQALEVAFGNELDAVDAMARSAYTESYYRSIFEVQQGFEVGFSIGAIDNNKLSKVIVNPWAADGKIFSDRIWQSKTTMMNDLYNEIVRTCITGEAPDSAIQTMSRYVSDKCKNAKYQAGRLVMTEQAYFSSVAQQDAFKELDVEEYEIVATLDSHTSPVCRGLDGKHFPMKDYKAGVTAPPFHVFCRSCTCPYFDDEFADGMRATRGEDGKTYYVPADMTYKEWKETFVDGGLNAGLTAVGGSGIIQEKVSNGEISLNVNAGHQNKHIANSHTYDAEQNKSICYGTLEDAQELIATYSGTGILKFTKTGTWTNKEFVTVGEDIGIYKSINGNEEVTNSFAIHYAKKGSHIVPIRRKS